MPATGSLPGFRDFYPPELAARARIFSAWRDVARRYGFVEYDGPPLEPLELYTRKSGDEIVGQLYTFRDKGDREVALRPEMTPTLARMVAARANALRKPIRWFSLPQLFRYERQQKGRLREHFQLNVDIIGEPDIAADAELIAVAVDVLRTLGLTAADARARVSDRRLFVALMTGMGVTEAQLPTVFAVADKLDREPKASAERRLTDAGLAGDVVSAVLEHVGPTTIDALRVLATKYAGLDEHVGRMERLQAHLAALGVGEWITIDLSIVRGLAYYTGMVFELFDAQGEMRAICGGGRYDELLGSLGGVDLPAAGFGMGDVVLGELLRSRGLLTDATEGLDYWVAASDPESLLRVMETAAALRGRGHSVEYALRPQQLGRQLKHAAAAGARHVVILGGQDVNAAVVKTLADGTENKVRLPEWLRTL